MLQVLRSGGDWSPGGRVKVVRGLKVKEELVVGRDFFVCFFLVIV